MDSTHPFHIPPNPTYSIWDSACDSARFTTTRCLRYLRGELCATSTFIDPFGTPALWHEFGSVEGPGWAANAVGGAVHLARMALFTGNARMLEQARSIARHCIQEAFFDRQTGLIRGYRTWDEDRYYWNYMHNPDHDQWLCIGSMAKIHLQLLEAVALDLLSGEALAVAAQLPITFAQWIRDKVEHTEDGWIPRRSYPDGRAFPFNAWGKDEDILFNNSGDGIFVPWLFGDLTHRGMGDFSQEARALVEAFLAPGGRFGSINHDTYDPQENVAYSSAFRALIRLAEWLDQPEWNQAAYDLCLEPLARFQIHEDRNGVATHGLLYMEDSWDTCYLWENAEAAWAYLEAANAKQNPVWERHGLTILRAAAKHHHGPFGFLTEGVDWNNHNGVWRELPDGSKAPIHVDGATYGDVNYTQPFLNNLHIVGPTLFYLEEMALHDSSSNGLESKFFDCDQTLIASIVRLPH